MKAPPAIGVLKPTIGRIPARAAITSATNFSSPPGTPSLKLCIPKTIYDAASGVLYRTAAARTISFPAVAVWSSAELRYFTPL